MLRCAFPWRRETYAFFFAAFFAVFFAAFFADFLASALISTSTASAMKPNEASLGLIARIAGPAIAASPAIAIAFRSVSPAL